MVQLQTLPRSYKIGAAALVAVLLFGSGWWGHYKWAKPVTVTVEVPVVITNVERPEAHSGNTVIPAHHAVSSDETPIAPNNPLMNPQATTVIEVPVLVPQLVKVYHQNSLKVSEEKDGFKVWVDGRVWATGEDGKELAGLHATTLFNRDAETFIPVTKSVPKIRPWAVGGRYVLTGSDKGTVGLFVDRDIAFVRLGVEANYHKMTLGNLQTSELQTAMKVGIIF